MTKTKKQKQKQNKRKENKRAKEEKKIHTYIYMCFNVFLMFSAFRDDMELYALSAGMVFPKFVSNE